MEKRSSSFMFFLFTCLFVFGFLYYFFAPQGCIRAQKIESAEDVMKLFPNSTIQIKRCAQEAKSLFKQKIDRIMHTNPEQYNYDDILGALDNAMSEINIVRVSFYIIHVTNTNEGIRDIAQQEYMELTKYILEQAQHNVALYKVIKNYYENDQKKENLSSEEKYYMREVLDDFQRSGINLPEAERRRVEDLEKEIAELATEFGKNIASDDRTISVTKQELKGLDDDFISQLKIDDEGRYVLGVDYPTYFAVMKFCEVESTRQALYRAFMNRANPANMPVVDAIIEKSNQLAQILGYESYAKFQIADEMAETPERVQDFLDGLFKKAEIKGSQEFRMLTKDLPENVSLTPDGKIYPWDMHFLQESYKKKHIEVDEEKLAEYFPLDYTLSQLFDIYAQFLGVLLEEVKVEDNSFWHEDVKLFKARLQDSNEVIGYIILDLFPRPHKYTHAANVTVVPSLLKKNGSRKLGVAVMIANFPKPTASRPSLLKREDVKTFFHEFGHSLHALLGATQTSYFSGTRVKTDFVEMPSQMLEEWMWDPTILKKITKHYKTGEPLSNQLIDNILKIKQFESGYWVLRQCVFTQLSLDAYLGGMKNMYQLNKTSNERFLPFIKFDPTDHKYLSFTHLPGYKAGYYSYLWSKIFALDLFYYIKPYGLLNREIGQRYVDEVLRAYP